MIPDRNALDEAVDLVQQRLSRAGLEISDMMNGWDNEWLVVLLAAMRMTADAMLPTLPRLDRQLFEILTRNSESIIMPSIFDPRRRAGEGAGPYEGTEAEDDV